MFCLLKKIMYTVPLLLSLPALAEKPADEIKSINNLMNKFIKTYEKRDLNALVQFYDPNAVVIGTGKDEVLQGRKQIMEAFKRDFEQHSNANISMTPIAVDVEKNVAFASYNLLVNVQLPDKKSFQSPLRFSVGLIKSNHTWLVQQSHLSAPLAGQEEGQSFPKS